MGDSHWYGDYLTGGLFGGARIRICYLRDRIGDEFRYRAQVKMPTEMNDAAFSQSAG
jgi:hypothetical protein